MEIIGSGRLIGGLEGVVILRGGVGDRGIWGVRGFMKEGGVRE